MHDVRTYIYIYDEDFSQLYDKCVAAIILTVEPQPAGPTFARSARVNSTCTTYERIYIKNIYIYIYIYMTKIFLSCTISVWLALLANY